jgi:hypothetical protein
MAVFAPLAKRRRPESLLTVHSLFLVRMGTACNAVAWAVPPIDAS